jgi:hypothetical protein
MNHFFTDKSPQGNGRRSTQWGPQGQSGFALIVSLLILLVLTMVAVTGLRSSIIEEQVSGNQKIAASSLFGAEQGVSAAIDDLFDGTISDSGSEDDTSWSASGSSSGTGYAANYTVEHLIRNGVQVEDDDGRRYFVIESTGATTTGDGRRMLEVAIALEWGAASNVAGFIGCRGINGDSNIVTGSYSSTGQPSDGDRGDMATTDANAFLYLDGSSDMDVVGEVRSTGAIYMKSDALVRRDALANLQIKILDTNANVYGSAYTNGRYRGMAGSVHGDIYQGASVVPLTPTAGIAVWRVLCTGIFTRVPAWCRIPSCHIRTVTLWALTTSSIQPCRSWEPTTTTISVFLRVVTTVVPRPSSVLWAVATRITGSPISPWMV